VWILPITGSAKTAATFFNSPGSRRRRATFDGRQCQFAEACHFHAAYLALVQPDQIVSRQGGDALAAWPIPDALTLNKPVRRTRL
jgi:hypothetical protein